MELCCMKEKSPANTNFSFSVSLNNQNMQQHRELHCPEQKHRCEDCGVQIKRKDVSLNDVLKLN